VVKDSDGLIFPLIRKNVIDELVAQRTLTYKQAADHEREAHEFSAGRMQWYVPVIQFLLSESKRSISAKKAVDAYIVEANQLPPEIADPVAECVKTIEEMKFVCTVPGCDEGGRRCPNRACRSADLEALARQTRSLDEGQTVFYKCRKCGEKNFK
jgi:DNA-directed RNA polymerase subunit M/transcription elongation factor TFIIS